MDTSGWKLDDFKKAISLAEFIKFRKDLGFIMTRKGTRHIRAYQPALDKDGNLIKRGKSIVKKHSFLISKITKKIDGMPTDIEVYWDMHNADFKKPKTIIDFINEHVLKSEPGPGIDFRQVIGVMKQYVSHPKFIHINDSEFVQLVPTHNKSKAPVKESEIEYMMPTLNTINYLKGRGIPGSTLSSPIFMGCYGSYQDKPAFLLTTINNKKQTLQYIDYSSTNNSHSGKYFLGDSKNNKFYPKQGSLYQTNFLPETNTICCIEAPEKAMAHYTLFQEELNSQKIRPQYLSSCGSLSNDDIKFILERADNKEINRFVLSFDNDLAGYKSTIKMFLAIHNVDKFDEIQVQPTSNSNEYHFMIPHDSKKLFETNSKLKNLLAPNMNGYSFIGKPESLFKILQTNNVRIHQSVTKDFLDDLNANKKLPFRFKDDNNQNFSL